MVDPLSVSSLTLQLIGTAREIYGVWKLLSGASAEFAIIADRLEVVTTILHELTALEGSQQTPPPIVLLSLERSRKQLEELRLVVTGLQPPAKGLKRRCSKALKIVLSEDKIKGMRDLLQTLLSDLSLALQVAHACKISKAVETTQQTLDQMGEIKQFILYLHTSNESRRSKELYSSSDSRSHKIGVIDPPGHLSEPSVAATRFLRNLSQSQRVNSFPFSRKVLTYKQWRTWVPLGVVSWIYQRNEMQEAHQQTLVPAYEQISVSLEPLISLVPGLAIVLARDRIIPRIYMRLHWTQMVPRRELMQELTWIEDEGILGLKQKVESRRLSVNAYEEYGLSLLFYILHKYPFALSRSRMENRSRMEDHSQLIKYLVDHGADTSVAGEDGFNVFVSIALTLALIGGYDILLHEMKNLIEAHDIDLAAPSRDGSTVLHGIASYPHCSRRDSALALVIPYRPDVNAKDRDGWTPLLRMLAANYSWQKDFFWWLVDNGVDVSKPVFGGPSTRLEEGLTGLHLTVAALQPVPISSSRPCYVEPHDHFATANIPAHVDNFRLPGMRGDRTDPCRRQAQKWFLTALISQGADRHAVARHWGYPTDIAKYTGNIELWCSILEDFNIDVGGFLAYDSKIPRGMEIRNRYEALERNQANSQLVRGKLQEFWRAIEHWNTQSAPRSVYAPLPLGHRSVMKTTGKQTGHLRYFLLRLLSNKRVGPTLVPSVLKCRNRNEVGFGLYGLLPAVKLNCRNQDDLDLVYSSYLPTHGFMKSYGDGGGWEARVKAFLEFVHVCQAKATGTWTIEQERARQTDRTTVRLADESLLRLLQLLTETVGGFRWPDAVMGWGEMEDMYPIGEIPGQWVEDEH